MCGRDGERAGGMGVRHTQKPRHKEGVFVSCAVSGSATLWAFT